MYRDASRCRPEADRTGSARARSCAKDGARGARHVHATTQASGAAGLLSGRVFSGSVRAQGSTAARRCPAEANDQCIRVTSRGFKDRDSDSASESAPWRATAATGRLRGSVKTGQSNQRRVLPRLEAAAAEDLRGASLDQVERWAAAGPGADSRQAQTGQGELMGHWAYPTRRPSLHASRPAHAAAVVAKCGGKLPEAPDCVRLSSARRWATSRRAASTALSVSRIARRWGVGCSMRRRGSGWSCGKRRHQKMRACGRDRCLDGYHSTLFSKP